MLEHRNGADDAKALPQLAYHFSEAGSGDAAGKAIEYATRAARKLRACSHSKKPFACIACHFTFNSSTLQRTRSSAAACCSPWAKPNFRSGTVNRHVRRTRKRPNWRAITALGAAVREAALGFEQGNVMAARSGESAVELLLEAIAMHRADDAMRVELLARLCRAYLYCDRVDEAKDAHVGRSPWPARSGT